MTVAVAHQVSATARLALSHAVQEAKFRGTDLAVLHVVDSALDADREEAYRLGVSDEIEQAVGTGHRHQLEAAPADRERGRR